MIFTLFKIRAKKNGYIEIGEWRFPNPVDEVGNRTGGGGGMGDGGRGTMRRGGYCVSFLWDI